MKLISGFLILFTCLSQSILVGQGRVDNFVLSKGDLIEDILFSYYDEQGFNGSVLVVENSEIIYENTFGFSNFESKEPLDGEIPFYLASLAKQFTAASILRLSELGKLELDDPVRKFLPLMPDFYDPVKIHHLLSHTSGVPDYFGLDLVETGLSNLDVYQALIQIRGLEFTPGNKYRYSNSGYVLLAMVIQVASGQPIANYFQEHIFDKLQMSHSFVYTEENSDRKRVKGYSSRLKEDDYKLLTVGDGGIYATANDLFKWEQGLNGGRIIGQESLDLLYRPVILANGRSRRYGYGWELGSNLNGKLVYHTGGLAGFRSYIEHQLESDNAIIILTNNSFSKVLDLRNTLVKILDNRFSSTKDQD